MSLGHLANLEFSFSDYVTEHGCQTSVAFTAASGVHGIMGDWGKCVDFGISIAIQARTVILDAFKTTKVVALKSSPADLVTETDQRVENLLISAIKEKYPTHKFIGEESVAAGVRPILTDSPTWIIDPIDGTTNFVHRFPFVAVSIAFVVNKQTEFGLVYSCMEDKLYRAQRGKGAFCNDVPLCTSGQEDITKALVVTEIGSERDDLSLRTLTSNIYRLLKIPVHGVRTMGTAAVDMCSVATAGADAYYHVGMHCWDIAASALIVSEAGGVVLDVTGDEFDLMSRRVIAASSHTVARRIAQVVEAFPCERDDGLPDTLPANRTNNSASIQQDGHWASNASDVFKCGRFKRNGQNSSGWFTVVTEAPWIKEGLSLGRTHV
ncbi:inositol monophosphatase 1-like [Arapaima gigas]